MEDGAVYREDVEEIIKRIGDEINELKEKKDKYIIKTDSTVAAKKKDIEILEKVAEALPEKQPPLFEKVR